MATIYLFLSLAHRDRCRQRHQSSSRHCSVEVMLRRCAAWIEARSALDDPLGGEARRCHILARRCHSHAAIFVFTRAPERCRLPPDGGGVVACPHVTPADGDVRWIARFRLGQRARVRHAAPPARRARTGSWSPCSRPSWSASSRSPLPRASHFSTPSPATRL